jgi:acetyl esterase/lipase
MLDLQQIICRALNVLCYLVPVSGTKQERAKDQHVERPLQQLDSVRGFGGHMDGRHSTLNSVGQGRHSTVQADLSGLPRQVGATPQVVEHHVVGELHELRRYSPKPSAVVMAHTAHTDYAAGEPSTFVVVGEEDRIAPPATMERRVQALRHAGTEVEYRRYPNLGHGFGLGTGTSAEGWIFEAMRFWETPMRGRSSKPRE